MASRPVRIVLLENFVQASLCALALTQLQESGDDVENVLVITSKEDLSLSLIANWIIGNLTGKVKLVDSFGPGLNHDGSRFGFEHSLRGVLQERRLRRHILRELGPALEAIEGGGRVVEVWAGPLSKWGPPLQALRRRSTYCYVEHGLSDFLDPYLPFPTLVRRSLHHLRNAAERTALRYSRTEPRRGRRVTAEECIFFGSGQDRAARLWKDLSYKLVPLGFGGSTPQPDCTLLVLAPPLFSSLDITGLVKGLAETICGHAPRGVGNTRVLLKPHPGDARAGACEYLGALSSAIRLSQPDCMVDVLVLDSRLPAEVLIFGNVTHLLGPISTSLVLAMAATRGNVCVAEFNWQHEVRMMIQEAEAVLENLPGSSDPYIPQRQEVATQLRYLNRALYEYEYFATPLSRFLAEHGFLNWRTNG